MMDFCCFCVYRERKWGWKKFKKDLGSNEGAFSISEKLVPFLTVKNVCIITKVILIRSSNSSHTTCKIFIYRTF